MESKVKKWFSTGPLIIAICLFAGPVFCTTNDTDRTSVTGSSGDRVEDVAATDEPASGPLGNTVGGTDTGTAGQPFKFSIGGYLREHISINLQNPPETKENDRWNLSMARTSLQLEADGSKGDIKVHAVGRIVGEMNTDYLKRLENLGAANGQLMDKYNVSELRELFIELSPLPRTTLRLGKQQIVWGETDFFHAMDIVHGYDFTWRSFLEPENEDYRKPLILANAMIQVPEIKGTLQLYLRPAFDRDKDIGNTYDLFGGRWANQPNKGVNFLSLLPYNFRHPDGDTRDLTWGVRWFGVAGPVNYSLAYLRSFGPDPVVNSAFAPSGTTTTLGSLGEFIFPKVDVYGLTLNTYSGAADAVFSAEVAYTKKQFFNVGPNFFGGVLPGFGGIIKKDTVRSMLRMDKDLHLSTVLGTSKDPFFSVQFFDTWVLGFNENDGIVDTAGFGGAKKEHSTLVTVILGLNYMQNRINPQLAGGYDLTYGGGFVIPSVSFAFGDKWRLNAEADLFFPKHSKGSGQIENGTHIIGYFAHNDQLSIRLTRQF